jgi:hypothetical protein
MLSNGNSFIFSNSIDFSENEREISGNRAAYHSSFFTQGITPLQNYWESWGKNNVLFLI